MDKDSSFAGFSKEFFKFFSDLEKHNDKHWFEENRGRFTEYVMKPAEGFVVDMGKRLRSIAPRVVADPRRDRSIFRLNRDTRFSADKTPYKTHIGIFFWEGPRRKMDNSGFYLHLSKSKLFIGVGLHIFSRHLLEAYRESVVHPKYGTEMVNAIREATKNPSYKIGWRYYKKVPRGYDSRHPNAEWLLFNGLGVYSESSPPSEVYSQDFIDYCFNIFRDMSPIHNWLLDMNLRSSR
ncbi:MAG: DUF2461 domain-containing protein [Thermodesulfobacteriota bacterium]